ncbi:MAG: hypothetical protein GY749_20510 [Desulfobacteraceae bacterium]|nr:hypothetical protein [Desulfobacteraceae bacterium]
MAWSGSAKKSLNGAGVCETITLTDDFRMKIYGLIQAAIEKEDKNKEKA